MKFVLRWEWASLPRSRFLREILRGRLGIGWPFISDKWKATLVCQGVKVFVDGAKKRTERKVGLGRGKLRENDSG